MERLSGLDASFLYLETPTHHMHVAMTMVLDPSTMPGGYTFEKLKDFIGERVHLIAPMHRRLVEVPLGLSHPVWVNDPDFELDFHVRRIGCPAPGGRRELAEMAGQIASTPLDRRRPLWEMWIIEGLKQDRIGIVAKIHHSGVDGASGAEMMVHLFSLEPEAPPPPPPPADLHEHVPSELELLGHAVVSNVRKTIALPKVLGDTIGAISRVVEGRRDPGRPTGAVPLTAPRTSWNGPLSPSRSVGFARVGLAEVKELRAAFGCTVNDVVLSLCAGALRSYLRSRGELPTSPLVVTCPVSAREPGDTSVTNRVSAMFSALHTELDDPVERVRAIADSAKGAKEEHRAVGSRMLQSWAEYAGANTFNLASRLYSSWGLAGAHRPIHNLIVSNVPGPPFPLYFGGAEVIATYPMGPVMEGVGLNVTVFSYVDAVDFGFMVDSELVPDVWDMADRVKDALAELQAAAAGLAVVGERDGGLAGDGGASSRAGAVPGEAATVVAGAEGSTNGTGPGTPAAADGVDAGATEAGAMAGAVAVPGASGGAGRGASSRPGGAQRERPVTKAGSRTTTRGAGKPAPARKRTSPTKAAGTKRTSPTKAAGTKKSTGAKKTAAAKKPAGTRKARATKKTGTTKARATKKASSATKAPSDEM